MPLTRALRLRPVLGLVLAFLACRGTTDSLPPSAAVRVDLLRVRPERIELETRRLRFATDRRRHLRKGWSKNEWNPDLRIRYVWAKAKEASVAFRILDVRELQFLVELTPFPSPEPQQITVLVNDETVATIDPRPGFFEYRFVAPASALRNGENVLTFRHAVFRKDRRHRAAGYVSLLLGPNCLRLRPTGPPPPTAVRREGGELVARGPAEITYEADIPAGGRLELVAEADHEPARVVVSVDDGAAMRELEQVRLARTLFHRSGSRSTSVDLSAWSGRTVRLRLGVYPDPCGSAFATARFRRIAIVGNDPSLEKS